MALQKDFTNDEGNTGNYWKITSRSYNDMADVVSVTLSLFKDYTSRMVPTSSMSGRSYSMSGDLTRAQIYDQLKSIDSYFSDAHDV